MAPCRSKLNGLRGHGGHSAAEVNHGLLLVILQMIRPKLLMNYPTTRVDWSLTVKTVNFVRAIGILLTSSDVPYCESRYGTLEFWTKSKL